MHVCVQVSEGALTRALASHFSWLCSCVVLPADLTADSFTQLGGIVYYRGSILSPDSERLVSNLSSYIMTGRGRMRFSGSHLAFLSSCPTQMDEEFCTISQQDSAALRCSVQHDEGTEPATELLFTDDRSPWLVVSIVLGTSLLVSVTFLLLCSLYRCYRKFLNAGKPTFQKSPSILPHVNGNLVGKEERIVAYASRPSESSR